MNRDEARDFIECVISLGPLREKLWDLIAEGVSASTPEEKEKVRKERDEAEARHQKNYQRAMDLLVKYGGKDSGER